MMKLSSRGASKSLPTWNIRVFDILPNTDKSIGTTQLIEWIHGSEEFVLDFEVDPERPNVLGSC
jgi:hypothetical protein